MREQRNGGMFKDVHSLTRAQVNAMDGPFAGPPQRDAHLFHPDAGKTSGNGVEDGTVFPLTVDVEETDVPDGAALCVLVPVHGGVSGW